MASKPNKYDDHKASRYTLAEVEDPKIILVQRRIERALLKHLKPKSEVCIKHLTPLLIEDLGFRACDHLQLKFTGNMLGSN